MNFITNASKNEVIEDLKNRILKSLNKDENLLFLVSGGSTAKIAVEVLNNLEIDDKQKRKINLSLIDERFGSVGHSDSNWYLLKSLGLNFDGYNLHPVLTSDSSDEKNLKKAKDSFNSFLSKCIDNKKQKNLKIIGLFGIGSDGHTAGILPDSPSAIEEKKHFAIAYKTETYTRITISPKVFEYIDHAVCWASGKEKLQALAMLKKEVSAQIQPAQYLKRCKEFVLYTDLSSDLF